MFFYWQQAGEDEWQPSLASERSNVINVKAPRFTTVLDLSAIVTDEMTRDDYHKLTYRGPWYADWDGPDTQSVLDSVRRFVDKLRDEEVDLPSVRWYATGGRGFHCEIPMGCFLAKPPAKGVQNLPAIYREIAFELVTDYMDMRVYSARRGRMWRTPNVVRDNGKYKVPVTLAEIEKMDAASYEFLCSKPRTLPVTPQPIFSAKMAIVWAKAEQKVSAGLKRMKDGAKDQELLTKFGGDFPPTLRRIMSGEGLSDSAGFNQVAMQVAITANALGKDEATVLTACAGLIENHSGDGSRYNSPGKRRKAIQEMLRYTADNVCYTYSRGAVKKILENPRDSKDLDGATDNLGTAVSTDDDPNGLFLGVFMTEKGIYQTGENGIKTIANIAFNDVAMLLESTTEVVTGFDVNVLSNGKSKGPQPLTNSELMNRQAFLKFCYRYGSIFQGTDQHVVALKGRLTDMALSSGNVVMCTNREGLSLIPRKDGRTVIYDRVWVTPTHTETFGSEGLYRYKGDAGILLNSDLFEAPPLESTPKTEELLHALLNCNEAYVMGALLGWMTSAHMRPVFFELYQHFPLLQAFGEAGSGKSTTVKLLMHLFYYLNEPTLLTVGSSTEHGFRQHLESSSSIPVVMEEYKPREMTMIKRGNYQGILRASYDGQQAARGGGNKDADSTLRHVSKSAFSAPLLYVSEALETQTAIQERTIPVPFAKANLSGREAFLRTAHEGRQQLLPSLGKRIVVAAATMDFDAFKERFEVIHAKVTDKYFKDNNHRIIYNVSVAISGLMFLREIVEGKFGTTFNEKFDELADALYGAGEKIAVRAVSEPTKVLNTLSLITHTEAIGAEFALIEGDDYVHHNERLIDIRMRQAWVKYRGWCQRKAQQPLYDNEEAFIQGLVSHTSCVSRSALDSALLMKGGSPLVFRFSTELLHKAGVEPFHSRAR